MVEKASVARRSSATPFADVVPKESVPLYRQLYGEIREVILSGRLAVETLVEAARRELAGSLEIDPPRPGGTTC